jgi:16S rRNA (cytidine1402-2'-O)-methyltransferase
MMPGTLHVVATPIGNLEDITLRALRVLGEVTLIAAEDTRRTAKLLTHHGISTPTLSFHEHNLHERIPQLLARLTAGHSIAVVTDAGTPGVSDPGAELVHACVAAGVPVDPLPGASAPLTAVVASGFPVLPLMIWGFAPNRSKDRSAFLKDVSTLRSTVTFFESPHRIVATLTEASSYLGDRPMMLGRELTKIHQEFLYGTASELAQRLTRPRGEFTVVVGPVPDPKIRVYDLTDAQVAMEFEQAAHGQGVTRRRAVGAVARKFNKKAREVYAAVERAKKSGL